MTTGMTTVKSGGKCPVCGIAHHGQCHKCPHDAQIRAGAFSGVPWGKAPCSACRTPNGASHGGKSMVVETTADYLPHLAGPDPDQVCDFFGDFLSLSRREQVIVHCRWLHIKGLENWPYSRLAKRFRITRQAVHSIRKRIIVKMPALESVM